VTLVDNLEHINKSVLPNGITVVTEHVDFVRSAAIGVWVEAGSRDENSENNGIAHFMEHMVFKGTSNRSAFDIANGIESLGGHVNAFTGKELTCFYAQALDETVPEALDVLSDILLNPAFRPDDIEREKSVVLEELTDVEDTPSDLIHEYFVEQMYPNHPLGYNILGTRASIQQFSEPMIQSFTRENYTPERLVVAVTGHVDHDAIVSLVENVFQEFSTAGNGQPRQVVNPNGAAYGSVTHTSELQQSHLCLGTRTFAYDDERRYALLILNTLLSGGMSSRLFQNIRERYGFVYSIFSFADFYLDSGLFGVYVGTEKNQLSFMQEKILDELRRLIYEPVETTELEKVKNQVKGSLVLSLESMFNRMNRLAKQDIYYNEFQTVDQFLSRVEAVTADNVQSLAEELFQTDETMVTTILRPAE